MLCTTSLCQHNSTVSSAMLEIGDYEARNLRTTLWFTREDSRSSLVDSPVHLIPQVCGGI